MATAMVLATGGTENLPPFWIAFMFGVITGMIVMAWMRKG
jgi:hypothetical protein